MAQATKWSNHVRLVVQHALQAASVHVKADGSAPQGILWNTP
jgi:hypothetical protein